MTRFNLSSNLSSLFCLRKYSLIFPLLLLLGSLLQSCGTGVDAELTTVELYHKALMAYEDDSLKEAQTGFEKVIEQSPETRLATVSYLKLGELHFKTSAWDEAEINYRAFLDLSPNSHLTPYVLSQLISLNYKRNFQGLIFKSRESDRNMEPNRKIIRDYQRFFFLYPNNAYLSDVKTFLTRARRDLADHEFIVGDFYFEQKAFHSAISRYLHLLKTYPEYPRNKEVALRLIDAYQANQQPRLADEMREAMEIRFAPDRSEGMSSQSP